MARTSNAAGPDWANSTDNSFNSEGAGPQCSNQALGAAAVGP